jgi:hypothetical protein
MSRDAPWMILAGVVAVAIIVALGAGAFGTTRTTTESPATGPIPDPASDGSTGVVFDLRASGGLTVLGLPLRSRTYEAHVGFIAPPACVSRDDAGHEELLSEGECANLPARGEVSGGGTTVGGLNLVIVTVDVSKRCYEALTVGVTWPVANPECSS